MFKIIMSSKYNELANQLDYNKSKIEQLQNSLTATINDNNKTIQELKDKIESLYSDELQECDFEFDFEFGNAVSVERIYDKGSNKTVIGYKQDDVNGFKEWYFHCSAKQHQKLAEQFRKYSLLKKESA